MLADSEFARNGGNFIQKNTKLYRVSQDCKRRYGYKINIMKVDILNKKEYKEKRVKMIYPPKGYIALHTLNSANKIEVADGKRVVINLQVFIEGLLSLIRIIMRKIYAKFKISI